MAIVKRALLLVLLVTLTLPLAGCARSARDTTGFAISETASISAPYEQVWQTAKTVLREREEQRAFEIYTRDKRGVFMAFENTGRRAFLVPSRIQYTVAIEPVGENESLVAVETIRQVYGVTLTTYPGWHDRPMTDPERALQLLNDIQTRVAAE